jgi:hypothetical protein
VAQLKPRHVPTRPMTAATLPPMGIQIAPLQGFSSGDDSNQDHNDGDHKEDMNEASDCVRSHQPEQPENE